MKQFDAYYDAELYSKEALLKAAYAFLKEYYIHLSIIDGKYKVSITKKDGSEVDDTIARKFENELLSQTVRLTVYKKTHTIREILMARAMASTMVLDGDPLEVYDEENEEVEDLNTILEDWFAHE